MPTVTVRIIFHHDTQKQPNLPEFHNEMEMREFQRTISKRIRDLCADAAAERTNIDILLNGHEQQLLDDNDETDVDYQLLPGDYIIQSSEITMEKAKSRALEAIKQIWNGRVSLFVQEVVDFQWVNLDPVT